MSGPGIENYLVGSTGQRNVGRGIDDLYCPRNKGWGKTIKSLVSYSF